MPGSGSARRHAGAAALGRAGWGHRTGGTGRCTVAADGAAPDVARRSAMQMALGGARALAALAEWVRFRGALGPDHEETRAAKQALDAAQAALDKPRPSKSGALHTPGVLGGADQGSPSEW